MSFRLRAFLTHLSLSIILALIAIYVVFFIWYPQPLNVATGVTSIFLILLGVDVSLGPLLTLLVAKENKPSLKLDLGIIIALQMAAFVYGVYVVAEGRPVWLVFSHDRFDLVQAYELKNPYRMQAEERFQGLSFKGPAWVAAQPPTDKGERSSLLFESIVAGIDLPQRPDLYVPYEAMIEDAHKKAKPLSDLNSFNPEPKVIAILASWSEADAYLPLMAPAQPMVVLLDTRQGKILGIVPLHPWAPLDE